MEKPKTPHKEQEHLGVSYSNGNTSRNIAGVRFLLKRKRIEKATGLHTH